METEPKLLIASAAPKKMSAPPTRNTGHNCQDGGTSTGNAEFIFFLLVTVSL